MKDTNKRRIADRLRKSASVLGEGGRFIGDFSGNENYIVSATVEGSCNIEGVIMVQPAAHWTGTIIADDVLIAGTVEGDIQARNQLEVLPGARIVGNISGASIAVAEGAILDGTVRMIHPVDVTRFTERRESEEN